MMMMMMKIMKMMKKKLMNGLRALYQKPRSMGNLIVSTYQPNGFLVKLARWKENTET